MKEVDALLGLYWVAPADEDLDARQVKHWWGTLGDIPMQAIERGLLHWSKHETRKPKPAEIRKLIFSWVAPKKPIPPPEDDDWPFGHVVPESELQHRRKMQDAIRADFPMLRPMDATFAWHETEGSE